MVYIKSQKDSTDFSRLIRVDENGKFRAAISLPQVAGQYYFVLASGNSFQTPSYS